MNEVIRAAAALQAVCDAEEDLLVLKAFAAREKDWVDVDGILIRQEKSLDWDYVRAQLTPLAELKEEPELVQELERRRAKVVAERGQ